MLGMWLLLIPHILNAQTNTLLSIQSDTTALQTGQTYTFTLQIENIEGLWLAGMEIAYDPEMLYILGTASGQPVTPTDIFSAGSFTLDNRVNADRVLFMASRVAPDEPFSGSGAFGTFQIFPLQAGTTQIAFRTAQMTKVNFVEQDGRRIGESTEELPFTPVLLELTITGNAVTPPPEFTATPTASPTIDPTLFVGEGTAPVEPTLVNVTAAPRPGATPTPLALLETPDTPAESSGVPLLAIAAGIIIVSVLGLLAVLIQRRKRE